MLVPSLLRSILLYLEFQEGSRKTPGQTPLQALKVWVCSGEPLATELAAQFFDRFHSDDHVLCNFYGSTEVTDVTYHVLGGALSKEERIPIGKI
jgi:acyl-coenzyme A synthetase/AMP-(fatty) acid ligase